jgi:hypothetical protein
LTIEELSLLDAATWWLGQGFALLPCQPNSKIMVRGFGPHKQRVVTLEQAEHWWGGASRANLAVVCPEGFFVLDFDDRELLTDWFFGFDNFVITYMEFTPRGGAHAFLKGEVPRGVVLREGVELKTNVLVAPSMVDGRLYRSNSFLT